MKSDLFLEKLLDTRSPTGTEGELNAVLDSFVKDFKCEVKKDVLGNRFVSIGKGERSLMIASHSDEIGFIVTYIDDNGFIFFDKLGGHDNTMIAGRRVDIITKKGIVSGVTGKKAIHLMTDAERKSVPETHHHWIDIGLSDKKSVEGIVSIGDSVVYDYKMQNLAKNRITARALDDKAGCYCAFESLRRLSKKKIDFKVCAVATTQEEIGTRGAQVAGYALNPDAALVIDVEHATDYPNCDKQKYGSIKLGAGVVISRGPNISPVIFDKLIACAKKAKIKYQINAEPRPTGTDARVIQMARSGIATGLLGIPLRYMHTPSEILDTDDLESCVKLIEIFAETLKNSDNFNF